MDNHMRVEITLKNYRCFTEERPARFVLADGTIGVVAVNNAGKSTLLRFFFEFRNLFGQLQNLSGDFHEALKGNQRGLPEVREVRSADEVFTDANDGDLTIEFLSEPEASVAYNGVPFDPSC